MPLLPHTGLLVPDGAPRVVAVSELAMARGLCWVAHVRLGDRLLGTIENAGNGQETEFFPVEEEPDFTGADFTVFAAGCRRDGGALDEQEVMGLLVEEFECAAIVRDVRGHTGTYARQVTAGRITGWAEVDHRPRTHAELTTLARHLAPRPPPTPECARRGRCGPASDGALCRSRTTTDPARAPRQINLPTSTTAKEPCDRPEPQL